MGQARVLNDAATPSYFELSTALALRADFRTQWENFLRQWSKNISRNSAKCLQKLTAKPKYEFKYRALEVRPRWVDLCARVYDPRHKSI